MMWWHGNWNGWAWLAMSASMVVFWGLVIWAVARVVSTTGSNTSTRAGNDPEQILRQRFARGEIDTEEFEHRRELLRR